MSERRGIVSILNVAKSRFIIKINGFRGGMFKMDSAPQSNPTNISVDYNGARGLSARSGQTSELDSCELDAKVNDLYMPYVSCTLKGSKDQGELDGTNLVGNGTKIEVTDESGSNARECTITLDHDKAGQKLDDPLTIVIADDVLHGFDSQGNEVTGGGG